MSGEISFAAVQASITLLAGPAGAIELTGPDIGEIVVAQALLAPGWGAIEGKPETFPPASHDHDARYSQLGHAHVIADVTGLQAALDGKQDSGSYAAASHTHAASQISDSTAAGQSMLTAADAAAQTALLGTAASGLKGLMSGSDKSKLDGIAAGATANSSDAALLARANHTGTQLAATISDFNGAADARAAAVLAACTARVTVDFTTASPARFFDVAFVGAVVGQKVLVTAALDMPAGVAADELEMDPITVAANVVVADQVRLLVASVNRAPLGGQRSINVTLI